MGRRTSSASMAMRPQFWPVLRGVFALVFFFYFYCAQQAALTLLQHRLSQGVTSYSPLWGALVITFLLIVLQRFVEKAVILAPRDYPLTYFPSALCAVLLTAIPYALSGGTTWPLWLSGCLVVGWIILVATSSRGGTVSRGVDSPWQTFIQTVVWVVLLTFYMGVSGDSDRVVNYEVQMARHLQDGDIDAALKVGEKSLATSETLTAYRAYALARSEKTALDELFSYPLTDAGSEALLPRDADSLKMLLSPRDVYAYLHLPPPAASCSAAAYFRYGARRAMSGRTPALETQVPAVCDYRLCALLLDRDLEQFARELPEYYVVSDSVILPRYYAEAIILYQRIVPEAHIIYTDPNIIANYVDFKEKGEAIGDVRERRCRLWREYGQTYWWYYFYQQRRPF